MTFGDKLKELRQSAGLTQAVLANKSGVPLGTIRDYEQGKRDPLLSNAQRLAAALYASLDVFPPPKAEPSPDRPAPRARPEAAQKGRKKP